MAGMTNICGYGGIGRRAGFRFQWATVQVRVLLSALKREVPNPLKERLKQAFFFRGTVIFQRMSSFDFVRLQMKSAV